MDSASAWSHRLAVNAVLWVSFFDAAMTGQVFYYHAEEASPHGLEAVTHVRIHAV